MDLVNIYRLLDRRERDLTYAQFQFSLTFPVTSR